jgi:glutaredoxin
MKSSRKVTEIIVYTKPDCPLCDEGKEIVSAAARGHLTGIREVDITGNPQLMKAYGIRIPVVVIDGELITCGRIDPTRIAAKLNQRKDQPM